MILFAINGSALSPATHIPGFPTDNYRDFLIAMPFIQGAMFVSITAGVDLARDIESGFINRLAMTPLHGDALLIGQLGGALVIGVIQAVVYLLFGIATGVTLVSGVGGALVLLLLSILISFAFASLGEFLALRFGTGEAVQGIFPLLFVTLFLSSSSLPRNLIKASWFREVATYNPISLSPRGASEPGHHRLGCPGAGAGIRVRDCAPRGFPGALAHRDEDEAGPEMRRFLSVVQGVAWRSIHNTIVNPAILVPSIVFPLFFLIAFAGGLSRISDVPNFHYPPGYTSFQISCSSLQSAAFGGVFTGFAVARDFDSGFARRLRPECAAARRHHRGYIVGALLRWASTGTVVTIAALIAGINVDGSGVQPPAWSMLGVGLISSPRSGPAGWPCPRTEQAGALISDAVFVLLSWLLCTFPCPCSRVGFNRRCRSGDSGAGGWPRPAGGVAGQGRDCVRRAGRRRDRPGRLCPAGLGAAERAG